jgi:hypothetical protein
MLNTRRQVSVVFRLLAEVFPVMLAGVLVGCGDGVPEPTDAQAKVSGTVTFEGKPVTVDTAVVFYCAEKDATAAGMVDSLGNYTLSGGDKAKGVPAGRYEVMITPPVKAAPAVGSDEYQQMMMGKATKVELPKDVPVKFHTFETSKLVFEVKEGENKFNFELDKL